MIRRMRSRAANACLVGAIALLLTIVMTWPFAPRVFSAGRTDSGDGMYSVWNVAWVAHALVANPLHLYDANIYAPHRRTLSFSEPNIGAGLLAVPFYWSSGRNPHVAHNAVLLLAFVLTLVGTYSLVRHLSGDRGAAAVAAAAFAFCPYVFSHIPHIQLLMTAGIPFSLLAMHHFVAGPTAGRAIVLGLVLAAQALSCGYYGIFAGLLVGYGLIFYGVSRQGWREPRYWLGGALAAAVSIAVVLPFFLPYLALARDAGFSRSLEAARPYSATWRSYFVSSAWAHAWALTYLRPWAEVLYPGTIAIVFGLLGLRGLRRRCAPAAGRDHVVFYASVVVLAIWFSLGPQAGLYAVLYRALPILFSWMWAPQRMGLICVLGLAVLAGFAIASWTSRSRRPILLTGILVALTCADLFVAPLGLVEPPEVSPVYTTLASLPDGVVAEFPFFYRRPDFYRHTEYMLNSTAHWKPLVNGYSDNIPTDFREMVTTIAEFPDPGSFRILKERHVRYVVVHLDLYGDAASTMTRLMQPYLQYLRPLHTAGDVTLYEIAGWPPAL